MNKTELVAAVAEETEKIGKCRFSMLVRIDYPKKK